MLGGEGGTPSPFSTLPPTHPPFLLTCKHAEHDDDVVDVGREGGERAAERRQEAAHAHHTPQREAHAQRVTDRCCKLVSSIFIKSEYEIHQGF